MFTYYDSLFKQMMFVSDNIIAGENGLLFLFLVPMTSRPGPKKADLPLTYDDRFL
jgi:hypothetical protein